MRMIKASLLSIGITVAGSALLLAIAACVINRMNSLPKTAIPVITTVIGCFAAFSGSFVGSLASREKGILIGLANGGIFLLAIAAVSLLIFKNTWEMAGAWKAAAILLGSSIGGILGVNQKRAVKF